MNVSGSRWFGAVFAVVVTLSACQPMESVAHEELHAELTNTGLTLNGSHVLKGGTARAAMAPRQVLLDSNTGLTTDAGTALVPGDPGAGDVRFTIDTAA